MASSSYSWHPHDAGKTPSWPTSANEEHQDMEPTLARWEAGLRERFSDRLSHLIWDRERIRALEEALDIVIGDDAQCPAHLSTFYRRSLLNRLTGLGPLDSLLLDDSVTEIMVNGQQTYIERQGKIERVELDFLDLEEVSDLARRLANRAGRELNTEIPLCDALLSDGSRIHCVLPPVSEVPTLTVRRMPRHTLRLDDYLAMGSMSSSLWEDISEMIAHRRNMIIAGGAGAGKTSLLRLLATAIDASERLVTIEDVRELNLPHEHTVRLEAFRQYSVNQLVINALRMRPDRIIVGEVRGPEALDLIEAMASGHPGSPLVATVVKNPELCCSTTVSGIRSLPL